MSNDALPALAAERQHVLDLLDQLTPEEWAAPSDCAGWRVQDVVAHMSLVFHQIADPASMEPSEAFDVEVSANNAVARRKDWTPAQVVAEYREWSDKGVAALGALQEPPMADAVVPMGNLGAHPLHLLGNAIVFDHYCHLRWDILAPNGPVTRAVLPRTADRLTPTMTWMIGGLPQMCAPKLAEIGVDRAVNLVFTGEGGGSWVLRPPAEPGGVCGIEAGHDPAAAATITSNAHDFVCWGTQRRSWRAMGVSTTGDTDYAARILDAVNII